MILLYVRFKKHKKNKNAMRNHNHSKPSKRLVRCPASPDPVTGPVWSSVVPFVPGTGPDAGGDARGEEVGLGGQAVERRHLGVAQRWSGTNSNNNGLGLEEKAKKHAGGLLFVLLVFFFLLE